MTPGYTEFEDTQPHEDVNASWRARSQRADEATRAENEACAKVADGMAIVRRGMGPIEMRSKIAAAIRARIE